MRNNGTERIAVATAQGSVMGRRSFLAWVVVSGGGVFLLAEAYRWGYLGGNVRQVDTTGVELGPEDDSMILRSARPVDAVEALNTNIRTAVDGVTDTTSGLTSEMILKADSSLMLSVSRVTPEVQAASDYVPTVNTLVTTVYKPDEFYEADGVTVRQNITRLALNLAQHPNETVRQQAVELAGWYLDKIVPTVYLEQDLLLACRMGDLAIRLNPELTDRVTTEVRRAVLIQEALNQAAEAIKAEEAVMARANTQVTEATQANTIVRVDERVFDGVQTVDDVTVPFTLLPFVLPKIGVSPQVLAAQLSALVNTFRGLPNDGANVWKVTETKTIGEALRDIKGLETVGARIASCSEALQRLVTVVKLEQTDCQTGPCQAWAVVVGGLIKQNQIWEIQSQGQKFLINLIKG